MQGAAQTARMLLGLPFFPAFMVSFSLSSAPTLLVVLLIVVDMVIHTVIRFHQILIKEKFLLKSTDYSIARCCNSHNTTFQYFSLCHHRIYQILCEN